MNLIDTRARYMKKRKIGTRFLAFVIGALLLAMGLVLVIDTHHSYSLRIRGAKMMLMLSRKSLQFFAEKNGKFPDSLHEFNEYGKKFPDRIEWHFPPGESISGKTDFREHSVLDGTGGLYYDPKTGELKLNLTRPLKSYWRFYLGEERNHVPADW